MGIRVRSRRSNTSLLLLSACGAALIALALAWWGCNQELGPISDPSGFSGVIRFRNWPPATSIREMRVVALEFVPTDSVSIIPSLLAGKAAAYPPVNQDYLPTLVDSVIYEFTTATGTNLQVMEYQYVAVWYQYGPNILHDWRPAGVYTVSSTSTTPLPLRVLLHRVVPDVNILVDFNNLPPVPWR